MLDSMNHRKWLEFVVGKKLNKRAAFDVEFDITTQLNWAREPDARRHDESAAAFFSKRGKGFFKRRRIQRLADAATKIGKVNSIRRDDRLRYNRSHRQNICANDRSHYRKRSENTGQPYRAKL